MSLCLLRFVPCEHVCVRQLAPEHIQRATHGAVYAIAARLAHQLEIRQRAHAAGIRGGQCGVLSLKLNNNTSI